MTPFEVDVTITPDGKVRFEVDYQESVDYETVRPALEAFLAAIGQAGAPVVLEGGIEKHTHDDRRSARQHVHR